MEGVSTRTGMALLNLSTARTDGLVLVFWDENEDLIAAPDVPLAGGRHTAFMLPEKFPLTANRRGFVVIHSISGKPFLATALRMSATGIFGRMPAL